MTAETLNIGWADEATRNTDPITTGTSDYHLFGVNSQDIKLPNKETEWSRTTTNSPWANELRVSKGRSNGAMINYPVDGLMWYYWFGDSASSAGVHTLSALAEGTLLPSFTTRYELLVDINRYVTQTSCVVRAIDETFSMRGPGGLPSQLGVQWVAQDTQEGASTGLNSTHTNGPALLGSDTYRNNSSMAFTWNTEDLAANLIKMQISGVNILHEVPILNQDELGYIFNGEKIMMCNFLVVRGKDASLYSDALAQTKRNLVFTIYNGGTNYKTFTLTNVALERAEEVIKIPPDATNETQYAEQYFGMVTSATLAVKDGVADARYGD